MKSYFKQINWSNIKKTLLKYWQAFLAFFKSPQKIYASNSLLMVLVLLGILIIINLIAAKENLSWDTTKNQRFSLSKQTITLLKELKDEIKVTAFFGQESADKDLLESYQDQSKGKITVEFINPDQKPGLAQKYGVTRYGTVVFELADKKETVTTTTESEYSGAILRLIHRETNKICFLTGHGEKSLDDSSEVGYSYIKKVLEDNGYQVEELNLSNQKEIKVPDDASTVVIAGPQHSLLDQEKEPLKKYLDEGGKILLLLDPDLKGQDASKGYNEIFSQWGIELKNGVVIDPSSGLFGDPATPTVQKYESHQITQNLSPTFFTGALEVVKKGDAASDYQITELAKTTDSSWLETDLSNNQVSYNEKSDTKGPINLAIVVQKSQSEEKKDQGRLIVIGDSDFVDNAYYSALGNQDLFMNSVRWLLAQTELLNITPKETLDTSVYLTGNQAKYIFWGTVVGMPLVFIFIGITVWYTRKRKRL